MGSDDAWAKTLAYRLALRFDRIASRAKFAYAPPAKSQVHRPAGRRHRRPTSSLFTHLRHDRQESPGLGLTDFLPSSFLLRTLPRLAIPPADIGKEQADIRHVQHPDPARRDADFVLANPPFNDSDRFRNQTFHA